MKKLFLCLSLAMASSALAVCQSGYVPNMIACGNHPYIQTQCWPPATPSYAELLDAYNARGDHVKLTCGGKYVYGYTHLSCADLNEAATTIYNRCCGTTRNQINTWCPGATSFITYP